MPMYGTILCATAGVAAKSCTQRLSTVAGTSSPARGTARPQRVVVSSTTTS